MRTIHKFVIHFLLESQMFSFSSSTKFKLVPMPSQILRCRVMAFPFRQDHRSVRELLDVAGQVAVWDFQRFFVGRRRFPEESVCIVEGGKLGACQVEQGLFQVGREATTDQVPPCRCTVERAYQLLEHSFVEGCESVPFPHILPGGRFRGRQRLAGDRVERPEPVCPQMEEGQLDARAQAVGQEGVPVEQERVGQVLVGHDPVFRDHACLHEVQHGQQQERLVQRLAESIGRPGASVGILPDGRKGEWWLKHGAF